jgi:hypothetical protein
MGQELPYRYGLKLSLKARKPLRGWLARRV